MCVFYSKTSATRYAVHALSEQLITKQTSTSPLCSCRNQYSSPKAAGQTANSVPVAHQDSCRNRSFRRKSLKFRMKPRDQDFLRSNLKEPSLRHITIAKNSSSFEDFQTFVQTLVLRCTGFDGGFKCSCGVCFQMWQRLHLPIISLVSLMPACQHTML